MKGSWLPDDEFTPAPYRSDDAFPCSTGSGGILAPTVEHDHLLSNSSSETPPAGHSSTFVPTPPWAGLLSGIGILCAIGVIAAGVATGNAETQTAGVAMIVVGTIGIFAIKRVTQDCTLGEYPILIAGLGAKIAGTMLRYWAAFSGELYKRSDALTYHEDGRKVASEFLANGHLPPYKSFVGTNFLRLLTGLLYSVMPPSKLGAFFVFGMLSFAGNVMFWRAARRVLGPGKDRRYLCMVMFIPSVVYWPSSLGKEAVVILGLGLASLGFARSVTGASFSGTICLALGVTLVTYVRPHIALVIIIAVGVATLLRAGSGARHFASALLTVGILLPIGGAVLGQANSLFNTDISTEQGRSEAQQDTQERTDQGGSRFENQPVSITNPVQFPYAMMTVIVRPFPWESPSAQELATSIESAFIGLLLIKGFAPMMRSIRRSNPYAIFALVNLIVFIVLFSNFNNFGILARQRTQVAPFLFFLMALPKANIRTIAAKRATPDWEFATKGTDAE